MAERPSLPHMGERLSLPAPGEVVLGKYSIVRVLGEGAMGVVFEAVHIRLGQRVAIKMLRPSHGNLPEILPRFEREARAAVQLRNPHVTRVIDVDVLPNGTPLIVMEYLEGHDLAAELNARGQLPIPEAVTYVLQVCEALAEAHRLGIIHRDIKPANLFLALAGDRRIIKVLDFGISKIPAGDTEADVTATFSTFGTPLYMSPEQMRSAKHVDARTDIWALGVVLYQLLAGRPPFDGESAMAIATSVATDSPPPLRAFRPDIPEGLERAVLTALIKDRDQRYPHVEAFAREIAPFAGATDPVPMGSAAPARSDPAPEAKALPEVHADPLAATLREGRVADARSFPGASAAATLRGPDRTSPTSVPADSRHRPAQLPPPVIEPPPEEADTQDAPLTIPGLKKTPTAVIATSIVLGLAAIGGLTVLLLPKGNGSNNLSPTPPASPSLAPPPPPPVHPAPPAQAPSAKPEHAPESTPLASAATSAAPLPSNDMDAGSPRQWVDLGGRSWLGSPLKNPITGAWQGFVSVGSAQAACRKYAGDAARVPSAGDFSTLTKPNSSGQREIDLEKTKPFDRGGIPEGFYWVEDGSRRTLRGRAITEVKAEDGQWHPDAYALCVKNR